MSIYKETVDSIVYSILDIVGYEQRPEEDSYVNFSDWAEDVYLYDVIFEVVDSYACVSLKKALTYILDSPYESKDVDTGVYASENWEDATKALAFEMLRLGANERIEDIVSQNLPLLPRGNIVPESNERQLWFGDKGPIFKCTHKLMRDGNQREIGVLFLESNVLKVTIDSLSRVDVCLEGEIFSGEPEDLVDLTLGSPRCIKVRRAYVMGNTEVDIKKAVRFMCEQEYLEISTYGDIKSRKLLLSCLR